MSRIYFDSPSGDREIYGTERHWMARLTDDVSFGVMAGFDFKTLARFLPEDAYPLREMEPVLGSAVRFWDSFRLWFRYGNHFVVEGREIDAWQLGMNTVLAIGGDPLKLCARLHGQCEIHAFVEGQHRKWLAGIIHRGIDAGLMRDQGLGIDKGDFGKGQWSGLARWLVDGSEDEPVVCSYSVCRQFPNPDVARWEDDREGEGFYDLPTAEQWRLAMEWLRVDGSGSGVELKPENWETFRFGHCKDAFWLLEQPIGGSAP